MDNIKKPSFFELVKSEVQDLDESLSCIPDLWGENPIQLIDTITIFNDDRGLSFNINPKYTISKDVRQKIRELLSSDLWV